MNKRMKTVVIIILAMALLVGCAANKVKTTDEYSKNSNDSISSEIVDFHEAATETEIEISSLEGNYVMPESNLFQGKIREICYGIGNNLLVRSDKLYLYDSAAGEVLESVDINNYSDIRIFCYGDGYAIIGYTEHEADTNTLSSTGETNCICLILDEQLKTVAQINLSDLLPGEMIVNLNAVAISSDASIISVATLSGIYTYVLNDANLQKIHIFNDSKESNLILASVEQLAFVEGSNKLAFLGNSFPTNAAVNSESVSSYGTINIDGSGLINIGSSSYTADEMLAFDEFMYLPASFKKADGSLLMYSFSDNMEKELNFSNDSEGKDGVYASQKGMYFATAALQENLTVRIYDQNENLLGEHIISDLDMAYFYRIPQVIIMENSRTCTILLGRNQTDMETQIISFDF